MTVELDDRYAKAKERVRRSDHELLTNQFRSAFGEAGEGMLKRLTTFSDHRPPTGSSASRGRNSRNR